MSEMIENALKRATDTKACRIGDGVLGDTVTFFRDFFPGADRAIVVEDPRTRAAAGERVAEMLRANGVEVAEHVIEPGGKTFHADYGYVDEVREAIKAAGVERDGRRIVPVAVGSGVVNDLTKRASGELEIPYLTVGTAASVDGYSSFGAALRSPEGAKQTYPCPAPRAIVADLDVMRTAPKWMAASGFADLMAKVPAGADWILAYELGAAEWHDSSWHTVQDGLKAAIGDPEGVAAMKSEPMTRFVEGLMLGGFAMQDMQSSRPASGAEHLFSHLLEMRDHTFKGDIVPHGIQVGVFTLFMCRVYEQILAFDYSRLDVEACLENWKPLEEQERIGASVFAGTKFPDIGVKAVRAKFADRDTTKARLEGFKARWPQIRARLAEQLVPAAEIGRRLRVVGAPATPEEIGSTVEASLADARKTIYMRDRYMSLDFLALTGQLDEFARKAFSSQIGG
ncbi:MAG: sn-glycerol-1-phosphate dehydrogenase [Kiritimatiellae bacterium]|nr:sn-glycerol-1-phosphate dehydrogenase [Kiritimatiellia bacterium]MBQ6328632.1 sn-glycerol-1-phosphate dehydrogenase [Kiritimatiellia bacterium]